MAGDFYQRAQGRQHGVDMLSGINSMLGDKGYVEKVLHKMEQGLANKPKYFAEGLREFIAEARRANG